MLLLGGYEDLYYPLCLEDGEMAQWSLYLCTPHLPRPVLDVFFCTLLVFTVSLVIFSHSFLSFIPPLSRFSPIFVLFPFFLFTYLIFPFIFPSRGYFYFSTFSFIPFLSFLFYSFPFLDPRSVLSFSSLSLLSPPPLRALSLACLRHYDKNEQLTHFSH